MIDWLLNKKANTIVYLFYSPWILMLFIPLTPFYGNSSKIFIPILLIIWIQITLYFYFTIYIGKRLISIEKGKYSNINISRFSFHSWLNFLLVTLLIFNLIIDTNINLRITFSFLLLFIFSISEIFRAISISKLITGIELKKKTRLIEYFSTLYLIINPLLGLWNLHKRLKNIFQNN